MRFLLTILVITALAVFGLVSGCSVLDRFGGRDAADSAASSGADLRVIDSSSSGSDMSYVSDQTSFMAAAPAAGSASTQEAPALDPENTLNIQLKDGTVVIELLPTSRRCTSPASRS